MFNSYFLFPIVMAVAGIACFIYGYQQPYTSSETVQEGANTLITNNNLHVSLGLGIGLILVALFHCIQIVRARKAYISAFERQMKQADLTANWDQKLLITDEFIRYADFGESHKALWSKFAYYTIIREKLCLFYGKQNLSPFIIELSMLSAYDRETLLTFLHSKLNYGSNPPFH
jgi:uncharacterized membrane protein